jgi:hypothetical protein
MQTGTIFSVKESHAKQSHFIVDKVLLSTGYNFRSFIAIFTARKKRQVLWGSYFAVTGLLCLIVNGRVIFSGSWWTPLQTGLGSMRSGCRKGHQRKLSLETKFVLVHSQEMCWSELDLHLIMLSMHRNCVPSSCIIMCTCCCRAMFLFQFPKALPISTPQDQVWHRKWNDRENQHETLH